MISAGEVGAVFTIKDEASVVLRAIAAQMNALQGNVDKISASFKAIKLPPGVAASIDRMDKAMNSAMASAGKLETSMSDIGVAADRGSLAAVAGFGRIDSAISTTQGKLATLRAEMSRVGGGGGGWAGAGRGTGGGGGHGGGGSFGVHERAGPLGFRSHDGAMVGAAVAGFSVWEALKASADLQQVQENLKAGGVSGSQIEKATRESYAIGQKYGLTARDVLQGINEIRNPLNKGTSADEGVQDAMRHMNTLASAAVVLKAQGGEKGGDTARELYDMVKSAEFRNAIGDKQFDSAIIGMVRADVATGGIVTPGAFLQMSQMAKGALPGLSDDFLYKIMPELAQEFKGPTAGTALASLYQQLISGQMRTKGLNLLGDLGMVNTDKVEYDKIGRIKAANPGFFTDADTFRTDPMKSIGDIIEAMKAHGLTSESQQRDEIAGLFGNRNAQQMAQTLAFQYQRLARGAQGISNTNDIGATSADLLANNPYTQWNQFTSATTNAGAALGANLMPAATQALNSLTANINAMAKVFGGDTSNSALHDAIFGPKDAQKDWLQKLQDKVGNNPIAHADQAIGNWLYDRASLWGQHPDTFVPGPGAAHLISGRDPRSPSTGPYAYTPAAPSVSANLNGTAIVNVTNNVNVTGLVETILSRVKGEIEGAFKSMGAGGTNGDSGHDGRAGPTYPDHVSGVGHN